MANFLPSTLLRVIIIFAFVVAAAEPVAAQEGTTSTETAGGGTTGGAGIKEEGGVKAKRLATGEYEFEETVIEGRLEKPVYLFIKRQQPEFKTVRFARDFWDDILRPIDKEEFEKAVKESKFDYVKNPLLWMAVATAASAGAAAGYQVYNKEWGQVQVYGIAAGSGAVSALVLWFIDRSKSRAAR